MSAEIYPARRDRVCTSGSAEKIDVLTVRAERGESFRPSPGEAMPLVKTRSEAARRACSAIR
jgi:hypothetical protein